MKKFYYFLLMLGLFLVFWAISFYYYNPTLVESIFRWKSDTLWPVKFQTSLVFFWGMLPAGLGLVIFSIYKLLKKKQQ